MPTRELNRIWCKKCENFEFHIHHYPDWKTWFCEECKTEYSEVKLSEIPEEKITIQRERYKMHQKKFGHDLYLSFLMGTGLRDINNMFSEPGSDVEIRESDAGQKAIDEEMAEERRIAYEERRKIREERENEVKKFKDVGRNDICLCGSGKKYKQCCLTRIRENE